MFDYSHGDGLVDNSIVEKDGKKYVYRSTSVYDPQTKRKKTVTEYIGRIDPETGELIEKKARNIATMTPRSGNLNVRKLGACYALESLAESCGLRDDLRSAFGEDGDRILTVAISLILAGTPDCKIEPEIETNMAGVILNTETSDFDNLVKILNTASDNQSSIDKFFLLRMRRTSDVTVYCHPFRSQWNTGRCEMEWESSRQTFFSIATDINGIPVYFEQCPEMDMNIHSVRALVDHVIKMGATEPVVILDGGSSSVENLGYLIDAGINFLAEGKKKTPAIKQMLGQVVKKRGDPRALRHYDDHNFIVFDSEMAVCRKKVPKRPDNPDENNETDEIEIIPMTDPRFNSVPFDNRLIAWACTENESNSDRNREQMLSKLNEIESRLMEMDPYEALDEFKFIAGDYCKYFDLDVVEGELVVKIRQKGVTAALNREGIFVVITFGIRNWNAMMSYNRCVPYLERMSKAVMPALSAGVMGDVLPSVNTRMIVQFCSLVLWRTMEKRIHDSGEDMTIRSALQALEMIMSIGDGNRWQTTEISLYSKHVLDILHISLPRSSIPASAVDRRHSGNDDEQPHEAPDA